MCVYVLAGQEEELQQQLAAQQQQLREAAMQLSLQRQAAGKKLKTAVESCLAQLAMEGCGFEVNIAWRKSQEVGRRSLALYMQGVHAVHAVVWLQGSLSCNGCRRPLRSCDARLCRFGRTGNSQPTVVPLTVCS